MTDQQRKTGVEGAGAAVFRKPKVDAIGTTRVNFALHHLEAASHFSQRVGEIEQGHLGQTLGAGFSEILWFASACVISSVAGLEAYVNELFADRSRHFPNVRPEISDKLWNLAEEKPTLEKFDLALLLKERPSLDRGSRPAQDVATLVKLRNALIHFKPEWDDQQVVHAKLSRQLARRFRPSPFMSPQDSMFPRGWATHGCTQWAVRSCVVFLVGFESLAGVSPKVAKYAARLTG